MNTMKLVIDHAASDSPCANEEQLKGIDLANSSWRVIENESSGESANAARHAEFSFEVAHWATDSYQECDVPHWAWCRPDS